MAPNLPMGNPESWGPGLLILYQLSGSLPCRLKFEINSYRDATEACALKVISVVRRQALSVWKEKQGHTCLCRSQGLTTLFHRKPSPQPRPEGSWAWSRSSSGPALFLQSHLHCPGPHVCGRI